MFRFIILIVLSTSVIAKGNWEMVMRIVVNTKDASGVYLLKERILEEGFSKDECLDRIPEVARKIEKGKVDTNDEYLLTSAEQKNAYLIEGNIYFIQQGVEDKYKMFCRKAR